MGVRQLTAPAVGGFIVVWNTTGGKTVEEKRPIGAVFVVSMVAIFTLVFWFVTYWLFLVRG